MISAALAEAAAQDESLADQLAPIAALLSGPLTLLGVIVGNRLQRRAGREARQEDRRHDVFARFCAAANAAWQKVGQLWDAEPSQRSEVFEEWREKVTNLAGVSYEVAFVFPPDVAEAAERVQESHDTLCGEAGKLSSLPEAERQAIDIRRIPEATAAQEALDAFLLAARRTVD